MGSDVVYIERQPWNEDPNDNYWKYAQRPNPSYNDFEKIKDKSKKALYASYVIFTGGRIVKYKSSSVSNAFIMGTTPEYQDIQGLETVKGRVFTQNEFNGSNKVVLGHNVAESLFGLVEPVGREVKLFGQSYQVIGVLKYEGENMFNFINFDNVLWITYPNITRFVNTNDDSQVGKMLSVKAKPGIEMEDFKGELTGILRAERRITPKEKDNFSINELSMLSQVLESVFGVMNVAGFIIGIFSLIVGMFSVANIMFVSVKERTNIIGIKKAIGAKSFVVLLEFLIESIILCIIGGAIGLLFVFAILKAVTAATDFEMSVSITNILIGVITSIVVGIIAGIIPAIKASKMDPVEAIRS